MTSKPNLRSENGILIANNGPESHTKSIAEILEDADEITIAVAFLKLAGAELLVSKLGKRLRVGAAVELFIGTDFFLTQPVALERLLALKNRHPACSVMIADRAPATFHPKAYVTRRGDKYRSLIGSANLTAGGLVSNEELSICVAHAPEDALTKDLAAAFKRYREGNRYQALDPLVLQQYASNHEINERERKKFEKARDAALPAAFDLRVIDDWYSRYLADPQAMSDLAQRKGRRAEALKVQKTIVALNQRRIDQRATTVFQESLRDLMTSNGGRHLWGSDDIYRRGTEALSHAKPMIALFASAQVAAQRPTQEGYETIRKLANPIPGVGINMATEILCIFAPNRYAIYNGNTVGALGALGIAAPQYANFQAIGPARYENLCATMKALGSRLGDANFSETDAFLNWLYWKTKKAKA
ncbi:phospholipase D-like domain-containing protein [Sphingomonas sp. UYEF23]|uniref:phospholipase D-like domain-containing protein n=1 Tax=Sphingomonas sp. UYEF23 TaxID=1756408 RepID=UPI0033934801